MNNIRTAWKAGILFSLLLLSCSISDISNMKPIGYYKNPTPTLMDCGQTIENDLEAQAIMLINQARSSHGLPALVSNDLLSGAARRHSTDMACNDFLENTGSDGAGWHELMVQGGYLVSYGGITTAGNSDKDTVAVVKMWSEPDDGIAFDTNPTEIGVGVVSRSGSEYGTYWTVLYALPVR